MLTMPQARGGPFLFILCVWHFASPWALNIATGEAGESAKVLPVGTLLIVVSGRYMITQCSVLHRPQVSGATTKYC